MLYAHVYGTREAVEEIIKIAEECGGKGEILEPTRNRTNTLKIDNVKLNPVIAKLILKGGDTK